MGIEKEVSSSDIENRHLMNLSNTTLKASYMRLYAVAQRVNVPYNDPFMKESFEIYKKSQAKGMNELNDFALAVYKITLAIEKYIDKTNVTPKGK